MSICKGKCRTGVVCTQVIGLSSGYCHYHAPALLHHLPIHALYDIVQGYAEDGLVTTWRIPHSGHVLTLPLATDYEVEVQWVSGGEYMYYGPGVVPSYTYTVATNATVTIFGKVDQWTNLYWNKDQLVSVDNWGKHGRLGDGRDAFRGCRRLVHVAPPPDIASLTDLSGMFMNAEIFNDDISGWQTRNATDMSAMFWGAHAFNIDISGWKTGKVTDMSTMFSGAKAFNQDIGGWRTHKVVNMSHMFDGAYAFNQDIGGWQTKRVTNMSSMFYDARTFNKDIGRWQTQCVTNMSWMFYHAYSFNQDIGEWQIKRDTNMSHMLCGARAFDHDIRTWWDGLVTDTSDIIRIYGYI